MSPTLGLQSYREIAGQVCSSYRGVQTQDCLSRIHADRDHRWTQMDTDSEA